MDDDLGWNDFELRSYDPQIGRFLQNDPYDQFASGYVGMGNDPVNNIDEDGGLSLSFGDGVSTVSEGINNVKMLGEVIVRSGKATKKASTIWSIARSFGGGLISSLTETAKGLVSIVTDPIGTLTGLAHAVTNPLETWNGIKRAANETWDVIKSGDPDKIAGLTGNLVGNLLGGGITGKALSVAGKLSKGSNFVKTVRKLAKKILCGCFLAGTLVFTDTGQKAIENIAVGDKVWAYNDTTGDYALKKVVSLFRYVRDSVYNIRIGEETIQATADHPFFIGGHWLRVAELKVGDSVKIYDGSNLAIEQITVTPGRTTVYNFEVEDYHTYYVSNTKVLVHNSDPCDKLPLNKVDKGILRDDARRIWKDKTGRSAIWDGNDVHHRIPLEWDHLMPGHPNRSSNLIAVPSEIHNKFITPAWNRWKTSLNGRTPTQSEIMGQALKIDQEYSNVMKFIK